MVNAIVLLILGLIIVYVFRNKASIAWFGMLLMLIYAILLMAPITILEKVPLVEVQTDNNVVVDTDGVFELHSGVTAMIDSEFIVTESIEKEDIENWLVNQHKNVYIYIKKGDTIIYSYNLGLVNKKEIEEQGILIVDIYKKWLSGEGIPSSNVYISLGIDKLGFYLER